MGVINKFHAPINQFLHYKNEVGTDSVQTTFNRIQKESIVKEKYLPYKVESYADQNGNHVFHQWLIVVRPVYYWESAI